MVVERWVSEEAFPWPFDVDDARAILSHMPAVYYVEDPSGNDLWISPRIESLTGYTQEEWLARPRTWEEVIHPDDVARVLDADRRARGPHEPFVLEYRMLAKDGRTIWVQDVARAETDPSGEVVRWHGVIVDVTDLHEGGSRDGVEPWFKQIVESSPVVLYAESSDSPAAGGGTRTYYFGPRIQDLSGYTRDELVANGDLWMSRIHPDDVERVRTEDDRTDLTGETWEVEYRFRRKDGRTIWIHDHAELVDGEPGRHMLWHGYLIDVTRTKEIEADLQNTVEMLRRADAHRRQLYTRLASIQEEERARIAREIHDDPIQKMTALALRLQLLDSVLADEAQRERLRDTLEVVALTTESLRRLLFDLSPPSLEREGLAAAVRDYAVQHAEEEGAKIAVNDRLPFEAPSHIRVTAFQVIREALSNARKHSKATQVEVTLEGRNRGLLVTVRDDGIGFDPSVVAWQPGHMGLGSIRDRAELGGGKAEIRSAPGEGTTVELWLPVDGNLDGASVVRTD